MEALLHYCWKHRLYPAATFTAADGRRIEIIDPGLHNNDAGPDFFNAKIRIDNEMWAGNVEIHTRREDWYAHGHHLDPAYDNVILHVVRKAGPAATSCHDHSSDSEPVCYDTFSEEDCLFASERRLKEYSDSQSLVGVRTHAGNIVPEISIAIPQIVQEHYDELVVSDTTPPCRSVIPTIPSITVSSWIAALQTERLMRKTDEIMNTLDLLRGDWEHTYFATLARSMGMGSNSDALSMWARTLPLDCAAHHRDNLFQIEALFFGHAGLLNVAATPERRKLETAADSYFQRLSAEYDYLTHKFRLSPPSYPQWRLMRMRPQNYPHIRIAQLARLYHERRLTLSQLLDCTDVKAMQELLKGGVSEYWEEHYTFGHESQRNTKHLSASSVNVLAINCAIPVLFAYGRHTGDESLCQRAIDLLDALPPESNSIIRAWCEAGIKASSAGETQALIQLTKAYCERKDCLRCRFGFTHLKGRYECPSASDSRL